MYFYVFLLRKIFKTLQFFQYTKIYETMDNVSIASFYSICLLAAIITMRLLILKILCGVQYLTLIFHLLSKAIVFVYYSVYLPFLLSKKFIVQPTLH